ncbi:MAG: sigma-54 dependent transcriptional regulator [Nitrospiraceae bacterium]|nr:sigma-54 dependent transcriptional regulator [Nitrospiraceae bacterium]
MQRILIVEDRASTAEMLKATLEAEGFSVVHAGDAMQASKKLRAEKIDLVLTDLKLPGKSGIDVLKASREDSSLRPVIVMTAYGSVEGAVQAMKLGAYDFITKPFDTDHLVLLIKRALDNQRLLTENMLLKEEVNPGALPVIVGKSRVLTEVAERIRKVAPAKSTVLLLGESGTGKELFARAIHHLSPRKDYPFVAINCAAIPGELLESELFGYEKGAFTGAERTKPGKMELAHMGTVFFDEVGELDPQLQAKLLRVLQESEIERVGGTHSIKIDVRVVAASNKDLESEAAAGNFREDLFYRLNVFPQRIPPLRDRAEDIPLLAEYFAGKFRAELKSRARSFSPEAMEALVSHRWKGNVRELENTVERAMILAEGEFILPEHLGLSVWPAPDAEKAKSNVPERPAVGRALEDASKQAQRVAEAELIKSTLEETRGNKTRAAEVLKVSYKTLLTKIKEYGLDNRG